MRCIDADDMLSIREKYTLVLLDESIIFIMIPANFKEVDEELLIVDTLGMKHFYLHCIALHFLQISTPAIFMVY